MSQSLNIGVIGHGRIGRIHFKNLVHLPNIDRISICDPKPQTLSPHINQYTDYQYLINKENPNVIIICSPTPTHFDIIRECTEAGIHVFCEKPVDLEIEKITELEEMIKASGIIFQVGFNRRFDPDFSLLKKRIDAGEIGTIHQIVISSRDPGLPPMSFIATSGGMMMDMTIHDFDMCRYLTGAEVAEVYSKGHVRTDERLHTYEDIDTATTLLTMNNQVTCTINNSRVSQYGYDQRIDVFGDKGMLSVANNCQHNIKSWTPLGQVTAPPHDFFLERYATSYRTEMEAFLQNVISGQAPTVGIRDALRATEIAGMANLSLREGRVIKVN